MLRNDLKIVKNDDLVEKKQETMYVDSLHENRRMVDVYMEWYEKTFKEICEKYGFEKGSMCLRDCMVESMHVIGDKANNFEDQEAKRMLYVKSHMTPTIVEKKAHVHLMSSMTMTSLFEDLPSLFEE